jgi:hypothetical protein
MAGKKYQNVSNNLKIANNENENENQISIISMASMKWHQ